MVYWCDFFKIKSNRYRVVCVQSNWNHTDLGVTNFQGHSKIVILIRLDPQVIFCCHQVKTYVVNTLYVIHPHQ